jgi:alkanesulfonate monooxygenase SsuD/methylene tetrahydromethanopterin reductase-like flavin-dependent oxidoreductase (luciferase family)
VRVGINVPQDVGPESTATALGVFCRDAESRGFNSLWVSESHRPGVLEPLTVLAHAAAATHHVRLGTAVLLSAFRPPRQLAATVASADRLSGGRLDLGVGLGNDPGEYARRGIDPGHRGRHFTAHLTLLRQLLEEETVSSETAWWRLDRLPRQLEPAQRPGPPLLVGASRGAALRRAVEIGDGWIGAGSVTPAFFRDALLEVRRLLDEAGRDPAAYAVRKRVYLHVGSPHLIDGMRAWFEHHYGRAQLADDVLVLGSPEECAAALIALRELGVDEVVLHPVVRWWEQLHAVADAVLPLLQTSAPL